MASFSKSLQSIKNPIAPATATPKPAIKKIKIANNGSHIKNMSDAVEAASKPTGSVIRQQVVGAVPKVNPKKRKADDTDISAAKPTTEKSKMKPAVVEGQNKLDLFAKKRDIPLPKTKTTAKCVSLARMQEDALKTLEERRGVAQMALDGLMPLVKKSKAIETAVAVLEQQIEDYSLTLEKLSLFGSGFEIGKIGDVDSQTLLALASWGLDVEMVFENVMSSPSVKAPMSAVEVGARIKAEVEDARFSGEAMAAIFGPDEGTGKDAGYDGNSLC